MVATDNQGGNEEYGTEARQEESKVSRFFEMMDMRYLKGLPGLLKAMEAVSCLIIVEFHI